MGNLGRTVGCVQCWSICPRQGGKKEALRIGTEISTVLKHSSADGELRRQIR